MGNAAWAGLVQSFWSVGDFDAVLCTVGFSEFLGSPIAEIASGSVGSHQSNTAFEEEPVFSASLNKQRSMLDKFTILRLCFGTRCIGCVEAGG